MSSYLWDRIFVSLLQPEKSLSYMYTHVYAPVVIVSVLCILWKQYTIYVETFREEKDFANFATSPHW